MSGFFYICEYLNISPKDFFDTDNKEPEKIQSVINDLKKLDNEHLDSIANIIKGLAK